jgi:two-component system chemotaxis response regulator CheY
MAHILAVDDAKVIRMMVKSVLESQGHQVTLAEDGVEAMAFARQNTVDLVITDLNMPNMSGMNLTASLRKLDSYQFIPILIMTTEDASYKKNKARNSGATGWIQKPVNEERLLQAVKKTLYK